MARSPSHFTPPSGSWLNAVENVLPRLSRRRFKRGSSRSIVDLQVAIDRYIAEHNAHPKPFTWTKPADQALGTICDAAARARKAARTSGGKAK